ncbi:MAG: hypothetical protein J6Y60_02220 [Treponema sp.]|nr:hypothetical protein [Treponema sp.]
MKYDLSETMKIYREFGCEDAFRRMIVADYITLNCDRHFGNFGFLIKNQTFEHTVLNPCFDFNMAFALFAEEGFDFGKSPQGKEIDFDEYLSKREPVIGSDYVAPSKAILSPDIRQCVEEIRETPLTVQCDQKFTEQRLYQINMIKNVQCERILGFNSNMEVLIRRF